MIWEKHRFEIWNVTQHPYKHTLSDFGYVNPALPGVSNVNSALNYIIQVLYPNTKDAVATTAALPAAGNSIGDYRVVTDDGDGKSAGYRWEQREGDVAAKWYKVFDVDWSTDAILAAVTDVTDDKYMYSKGKTDLDDTGTAVVGLYAGQLIYGGNLAGQNLTLHPNSGDGVGPQTGYVQTDGNFRPTLDATWELATATERFLNGYFSNTVTIGTLVLGSGSITDTSGSIDFGDEALSTTGNITGAVVTGSSLVADDTTDTVTLVPGSYTDTSGAVSFGAASLSTTGTLGAGVATFTDNAQSFVIDPEVSGKALVTSSTGTIDFGDENLETTGNISGGVLTGTQLNIDNIRIDGNTVSSLDVNGNINLVPDGTGIVDVQKGLQTLDQTVTGIVDITGQLDVDNLRINGNTLSSTDTNGNVIIQPDGTGVIQHGGNVLPTSSGSFDFGSSSALLNDIYISGGVRNATLEIAIGTLLAFRSGVYRDLAQTQPAQDGDALFYDSINGVWLASTPDSEVDHQTISGLTTGDAGHTQFVMLAGRAGGQVIRGGSGASEALTLESTSNATKGLILFRDTLAPETNASYSGSWSGTDIGDATHYVRDVYTKGEHFGLRLENVTTGTLPSASVQNVGRLVFATDNNKAYVDIGTQFNVLGVAKYVGDTVWNGTDTVKNVDVSSSIEDARNAQWQLLDNANNFEVMGVKLEMTSASNVRITVNVPLAAGSYRLIGIE